MGLPTNSEILRETDREVRRSGRAGLCQIVRTEGSTPGKIGWKILVRKDGTSFGNLGGGAFEALVQSDAAAKLADRTSKSEIKRYYLTETAVRGEPTGMVCGGFAEVFLEVLVAKPVLVICGGGPIGQALAKNAVLCDFDVVVSDDRPEFRDPALFPKGVEIVAVDREHEEPFLAGVEDRDLFVAVVSRCWDTDVAALASVLRQSPENLAYLGLMGSRRKVDRVIGEIESQKLEIPRDRFHAPIGLEIGAEQPGEIAISILGEMIQVRAQATSAVGCETDAADVA